MLTRQPRDDDEEKEERIFGTHPGDLGVIAIAAMFTLCLILIFFMPSPFAKMDATKAAAVKAERQKQIDKAMASGEISVGITPTKDH